jgi:undecaprenyl-diphosphatase
VIETISGIDHQLFLIMNSWNTAWLNPLMVLFSGQILWLPLFAFIFYKAHKQFDRADFYLFLLFLLLALVASDVTSSYLLKNLTKRLRPCRVAEIKALINNFGQRCGGRFGFVSSHASNAFCTLMFSFSILKFQTLKPHAIWIFPIIVGFSRIYLGVHYPGDVFVGMMVGASWGLILALCFKSRQLGRKSR